jgi:hypothetical protein
MKYRFTTVVVLIVYACVTLLVGTVHQHQTRCVRGQSDCAACDWQINAVTVVPATAPLVFGSLLETPMQVFESESYSAISFSFSASRAPPVSPA